VHSPFDLFALLLVISAGLAYVNYRGLKLPLTVGLLVGAVGAGLFSSNYVTAQAMACAGLRALM
jgi:hypothetical protein